eukprot:GHVS01081577.1.p1 GENE.GHVS01081577.1~~GHVS01081577.1.p1  ORF type:complete len:515 (-),score=76.92 GHVS01081577.1:332-1876(-)
MYSHFSVCGGGCFEVAVCMAMCAPTVRSFVGSSYLMNRQRFLPCLWSPLIPPSSCQRFGGNRSFSIMSRYQKTRPPPTVLPPDCITHISDEKEGKSERKPVYYGPRTMQRGTIPDEARLVSWSPPLQPDTPRSLKVALLGAPNAGKSSLMNKLLDCQVAAVSPKVNTTRSELRGVLTRDNTQLVFIDAPGIIPSHKQSKFSRDLVGAAWQGYEDADLVCLCVDAVKRPVQEVMDVVRVLAPKPTLAEELLKHETNIPYVNHLARLACATTDGVGGVGVLSAAEAKRAGIPGSLFAVRRRMCEISGVVEEEGDEDDYAERKLKLPPVALILNKVDLAEERKWVALRANEFRCHGEFDRVFFVSALLGRGIEPLMDYLIAKAKPRMWTFPPEMKSTLPKTQQVEEIIRSCLMVWFNRDVPYNIEQQTIGWAPQVDGSLAIEQELIVKDDRVSRMVCGVRNRLVFQLRKNVSYKLSKLWGCDVVLFIHVRALRTKPTPVHRRFDVDAVHPSMVNANL